jgi:hypothetical protein
MHQQISRTQSKNTCNGMLSCNHVMIAKEQINKYELGLN